MQARSFISRGVNSYDTGFEIAGNISGRFSDQGLSLLLCYATVSHDQSALLEGMRDALGSEVAIVGCSTQGITGPGAVYEDGYVAGAMGFGGQDLQTASARVDNLHIDSTAKGAELGRSLLRGGAPKVVVLLYDPLCGADIELFLEGLQGVVHCPIVGGGSGHGWSPRHQTFQYFDTTVFRNGACALALSGSFGFETARSHGTAPVGLEMTVTKSDGNILLELDGRPALDVWEEFSDNKVLAHSGDVALGIPTHEEESGELYLVRSDFGEVRERLGVMFQASFQEGTRVMLHHRTVQGVLEGTTRMGELLNQRLRGRQVVAALGFECGARTKPFLGKQQTEQENVELQQMVAPGAEWLGMLAWGEIFPLQSKPAFCNYTYPLLLLND